jgi:hypothetical protein
VGPLRAAVSKGSIGGLENARAKLEARGGGSQGRVAWPAHKGGPSEEPSGSEARRRVSSRSICSRLSWLGLGVPGRRGGRLGRGLGLGLGGRLGLHRLVPDDHGDAAVDGIGGVSVGQGPGREVVGHHGKPPSKATQPRKVLGGPRWRDEKGKPEA